MLLRVQCVPQPVADEGEADHRQGDSEEALNSDHTSISTTRLILSDVLDCFGTPVLSQNGVAVKGSLALSSPSTSTAKTRSPNYPVISLEDALSKLRLIYEKHQRYPASRETFVQLMGYSGLSGTSAPIVSALAKYGLVEGYGETRRVSELGQDLMLHKKGDAEYTKALRTAASQPAFFQDLKEAFPSGLPSDHSLRAALIKRGFNPKAIEGAVRAYRETLAFVESEAGEEAEPKDEPSSENALRGVGASGVPKDTAIAVEVDPAQRTVTLPLSGSAWATLQGPFPVTSDAWDQMMNVLQAMRPALVASQPSTHSITSRNEPVSDGIEVDMPLDE